MEMPKLVAEHARLLEFTGEWQGEEQVAASPWGPAGPALGQMSFRSDLNGFALIQDYVQHKGTRISFRGHGVFLVEPQSHEILWYWFDSLGFPPGDPARGTFDGQVLTLNRLTERGASRYTYEISADVCSFSIENKLPHDQQFKPLVQGRYLRKA